MVYLEHIHYLVLLCGLYEVINKWLCKVRGLITVCYYFTELCLNKLAFRPKKVLSQVSICVSMYKNLGNRTDSSWAENCDSSEHD